MKFLKVFVLLFLAMIIAIVGYQMLGYWSGLTHYPFVSSLFLAFVHISVLGGLCWAFYQLCRYKV